MKIHSDVLDYADVQEALKGMPGVFFITCEQRGSRSHARAFEVKLEGNSPRRAMNHEDQAATWDEWGLFLNRIYEVDPEAVCGTVKHPVYANAGDFAWKTGDRFENLVHEEQCRSHIWRFAGVLYQNSCTKCGAVRRWN